jgi:hypothetical protein
MRWTGHVARVGEMRNTHHKYDVNINLKRSLGISTRRWNDNIKMDFKEIRHESVE